MSTEKIYYLNSSVRNPGRHITYILDSNIVVGLSDLYYNRFTNRDRLDTYLGLYNELKGKDILAGAAIGELCWDSNNNKIDKNKESTLLKCINGLFIESDYQKNTKATYSSKKQEFSSLIENAKVNETFLPSLCLIKKFSNLYNLKLSNKEVYEQLINFIDDEHKMLLSYEFALITYFLFSNDNTRKNLFRNLFKLDSRKISDKNIFNGCWDIFFLRLINDLPARSFNDTPIANIHNICFITADKNLATYANSILDSDEETFDFRDNILMPAVDLNERYFKADVWNYVLDKYDYLTLNSPVRLEFIKNMNKDDFEKHYMSILKSL